MKNIKNTENIEVLDPFFHVFGRPAPTDGPISRFRLLLVSLDIGEPVWKLRHGSGQCGTNGEFFGHVQLRFWASRFTDLRLKSERHSDFVRDISDQISG
jgi:hypothetical protein